MMAKEARAKTHWHDLLIMVFERQRAIGHHLGIENIVMPARYFGIMFSETSTGTPFCTEM
jgi:hypothetical protein